MIDKALLAKLRKLLALSSSSNEHEAAAALSRVRALMDEHGITDAQLALAEIEESTARASRTQRPPKWENYLARTIERALGVVQFIDERGDRTFVGRGPTSEIAAYAFAVLFRQLKASRADYIAKQLRRCKPGRKRQRADVFCEGWAWAVYRKVEALMPERDPDELIDRYLTVHHPSLVSVNARGAAAKGRSVSDDYWRGHVAGRDVDLNQGVGGTSAPLRLE